MNYKNTDINKSEIKLEYSEPLSFAINTFNYVGYYQIGKGDGCLQLCLTEKPKWLHRKMMDICLGIKWFDN
jgi:hypothetical protein